MKKINILVTLNRNYLKQLFVLIKSISISNKEELFNLYLIYQDFCDEDFKIIDSIQKQNKNFNIVLIKMEDYILEGAPTMKRYPKAMYYRIFAAKILPKEVEKVLYLDPDIVIINSLRELYDMSFDGNYFIGCSHIRKPLKDFNKIRLGIKENVEYINSGMLLMNLNVLRDVQKYEDVINYINKFKNNLWLPDQDIISALYGTKIKIVDYMKYNLSDRMLFLNNYKILNGKEKVDLEWIKNNTVVIHYCGKNKPWNDNYKGILNCFYNEIEKTIEYI